MNSISSDSAADTDRARGLVELWRARRSDLEGLARRTAGGLLQSIKYRAIDRIIASAGKNARFGGYDDALFNGAWRLMEIYLRAVRHYESSSARLNTFSIKHPILGVYEAFREQLRIFADHLNSGGDNPVSAERAAVISAGVAFFMLSFGDSERVYPFARKRAAELSERFTPEYYHDYIDSVQGDVLAGFMADNYPAYRKAVTACASGLSDLQGRKALLFFYTFLSGQREILYSASGQAFDAERELSRNAGNSLECDLVKTFLSIVDEALRFYDPECVNLINGFPETGGYEAPEPESAESLYAACADMLANSRLIAEKDYLDTAAKYNADVRVISDKFGECGDGIAARVISGLDPDGLWSESARKADDFTNRAERAAETIACVFARLISFYRENTERLSGLEENDIIKGINETLIIKTEILMESIPVLKENMYNLNGNGLLLTETEKGRLLKELFQILKEEVFNEADGGDSALGCFYARAADTGAVMAYRKRIADICQREEERAEKSVKRFLKENVLFEISTFEEIIQYSVTRLRETCNDCVKDYIDLIDQGAKIIEDTLKETGVTMIRPSPHDAFNGREHEILMGERAEGFAKGEIIKYMTGGYRLNGQVLIRANVIAAK